MPPYSIRSTPLPMLALAGLRVGPRRFAVGLSAKGLTRLSARWPAGTKAAVVQKRAEAKDYLDIDAIISSGDIDLSAALAAGSIIYGTSFSPQITLKALSYYNDGNLSTLPPEVCDRLAAAVRAVDPGSLPVLNATRPWIAPGGVSP